MAQSTTVFHPQKGLRQSLLGTTGEGLVNFTTDNLFMGSWRLNQNNLDRFDPYIPGYSFFIWTKPCLFMNGLGIWSQFKALTERNFKSFEGISSMQLATEDLATGFAGNVLPTPTNLPKENNGFTLKHYELAGSPIREAYTMWDTGIRDPETGLATYHGLINTTPELKYSLRNHSAEAIYIVTDPSGSSIYSGKTKAFTGIEFAAYYTNVYPVKVPMDHLNYSSGDHGLVEIDIEFKGNFHMSEAINLLAGQIMKSYFIHKRFGDYNAFGEGATPDGSVTSNPTIFTGGYGDEVSTTVGTTPLPAVGVSLISAATTGQ